MCPDLTPDRNKAAVIYFFLIPRLGKNKITAIGGKYLARAVQKSTSMFDVG